MRTLIRRLPGVLALSLCATVAFGQTTPDPCQTATPPFTVTSGAPFTVMWTMAPTVPFSATNPTPVPNRHNGFYLQIDSAGKVDIGLATKGIICPLGTPFAGHQTYSYRTPSGVSRGSHTLTISAWNYVLDVNGNETTQRQESPVLTVPFDAGDPTVLTGPPGSPTNGAVTRGGLTTTTTPTTRTAPATPTKK